VTLTIPLEQPGKQVALFGAADRNLRRIREHFGVQVVMRKDEIKLVGESDAIAKAAAVLNRLQQSLRKKDFVTEQDVTEAIRHATLGDKVAVREGELDVFIRGHNIAGRTAGQRHYLQTMLKHDLTFCVGPAGSGKTYLAVAVAVHMLKQGKAKRIILARPAVEAGEKLGFLPGDLQQKVNPYLRPLFDALNDMISFEQVQRLMASDVIEVVPLAFMRGRTLNESIIILDEAQNTTVSQMMMFLTRLGEGSKMVVTGDTSQIDLPDGVESGLSDGLRRLRSISAVGQVFLDKADIVRHSLVQHIVDAYGDVEGTRHSRRANAPDPAAGTPAPAQTPVPAVAEPTVERSPQEPA
jgi:phosphate starvation-inducible protein PhoH and related proteins